MGLTMYEEAIKAGGYAVVTGAASGVGRVAALRFAQAGLRRYSRGSAGRQTR